jgi:hypothetical protein
LIEHNVDYEPRTVAVTGWWKLSLSSLCQALGETVGVHYMVYDHNDLRGALLARRQGRKPRGDLSAVRELVLIEPGD